MKDAGKRQRIIDSAIAVFAKKGFYKTTVSEIASSAKVADGTIYLYFKSKEDILITLFEEKMSGFLQILKTELKEVEDCSKKLRLFILSYFKNIINNRDLAEVLTIELRQSHKFMKDYKNPYFHDYLQFIEGLILEGQKAGVYNNQLPAKMVARFIFGALDEITLRFSLQSKKWSIDDAPGQIFSLLCQGLCIDKNSA